MAPDYARLIEVIFQQINYHEQNFEDHGNCEVGRKYPNYVILDIKVIGKSC